MRTWDGKGEMSPEQVAATQSRVLCVCGHMEMDHVIPSPSRDGVGEEPRECFNSTEVLDFDLKLGEEVVVDGGGCACPSFTPQTVEVVA